MSNNNPLDSVKLKKFIKYLWIIVLGGFGFLFLLIFLVYVGAFGKLPSFKELENPKSNLASEVISSDQVVLGTYFVQNRSNAQFKELSPNLINALLATEDIRFYDHSGIDPRGTIAIIFYNLIGKKRGSSTISQQLAKNLFPRQRQTLLNIAFIKLREWVTAVRIERNYTKEEIITMYFNTVDFGSNSYGIKAASRTFFNSSPDSLKIEEASLLVGLLKGTTYFSPIKNPERSLGRRNIVLEQLNKYDFITDEQYDSLVQLPINLKYQNVDHNEGSATYFREHLRVELNNWCQQKENYKPDGTPYDLYRDGLKIYTTINSKLQRYAEEAMVAHIAKLQDVFFRHWKDKEPWGEFVQILDQAKLRSDRYHSLREAGMPKDSIDIVFNTKIPMTIFSWKGEIDTILSPMDSIKYYKHFLRSGFMSMEPQTGFIRAWVGGANYKYFKYDQIQGTRQVGSTFKPFVYTVAIDNGWSPCFEVPNLPVTWDEYPDWHPQNSDKTQGGMVSLRLGLASSLNNVTAYVMKQLGPQPVVDLAHKMGITSHIDPYPSICLGTADVSLFDMVGAYSTFANKGVWTEPVYITRVEDKHGNILFERVAKKVDAISEETAYIMLYMLKGVTTLKGGTGLRLRGATYNIRYPVAGKTGTTQNQSDGWFIGITPDLVSGAWTGGEDRSIHFRTINLGEGANTALPVWAMYMNKMYADTSFKYSKGDFETPKKPLSIELDCSKYTVKKNKEVSDKSLDF